MIIPFQKLYVFFVIITVNGIGVIVIWRLFQALFYRLIHFGEWYHLSVLHLWNFGVCKWKSGLLRPKLYMNQTWSEDDHWKRFLPQLPLLLPLGFHSRCLEFGSWSDSFLPPLFTGEVLESSLLFQSLWEQDGGDTWTNTKREGERRDS